MTAETITNTTIVTEDGILIETATGEIVGVAGQPSFAIDSRDRLEWALRKISDHEARKAGLVAQKAAIVANCDALIHQEDRWLAAFHRRFDPEIESYARGELEAEGWRSKTLRTAFGCVSFRLNQGRHKILDMTAAVAWAMRNAPLIVRIHEDVLVSDVLAQIDDGECPPWLEQTPAGEKMAITTGVKGEKE